MSKERLGPSALVKPSTGLLFVDMVEKIIWSVAIQSSNAKCLISICQVQYVGLLALPMAIFVVLAS